MRKKKDSASLGGGGVEMYLILEQPYEKTECPTLCDKES